MRRKKNKQMEGQMSIFDMFSSVIENTKTEEENVTVSEGGIAAADITAVETGTQTSIFDLFSTDEQDTQKQEKKPKKNFFHRTIQFAKSLEDKWKNNLAALKMLLGLDDYADEDQQTILSSYEGWGGLSSYFEVEEKKVQLETLVGENTYKGIKSSILTSYYTNEKIINFMYQILSEIGVKGKLNILDPCMGTGNFYRMLPDTLQDSNLYGVELEETSCNIAKQLFQKANIQNCAFEKADLPDNYFDLIIGNVPFSDFSAADNTYGSCLIHDYFFLKALDLARPGGIVAMITTKGTMDKKSSRIRKMLAKKADLLCAIRLPETAFAVTGAKVSTDILFFQKRRYQTVGDEPEWVNIAQEANMYFGTHLNHMLGRMMEESGPYGKRFVCKEKEGMDWKACIDNFHLESYLKDVYEPGQTIENNDEEVEKNFYNGQHVWLVSDNTYLSELYLRSCDRPAYEILEGMIREKNQKNVKVEVASERIDNLLNFMLDGERDTEFGIKEADYGNRVLCTSREDAEKYIEKTKLILEIHSRGLREKDFSLSQLHELQNYLERTEK